jgi:agmatinase
LAPRAAAPFLTVEDIVMMGVDKAAEIALDVLGVTERKQCFSASTSIHSMRISFPEPVGRSPAAFCPREVLRLLRLVAREGLCGMEVVEVAPQYDVGDKTALIATRAIMDVLATLVNEGKLGRKPETRLPPPPHWPNKATAARRARSRRTKS